jgi:hypothetical protein
VVLNAGVPFGEMPIPSDLYGATRVPFPGELPTADVYVWNLQNGRAYSQLGVTANGYEAVAGTATHEGLHLLGIAGSNRAEALVRLAELEQLGVPIDQAAMRQVLTNMRNAGYFGSGAPWRSGGISLRFPGVEW